MSMSTRASSRAPIERPRYIERAPPLVFPESAEMPETQLHVDLRTLLYHLLRDFLGEDATVGSDQFVYFDAGDPSACVAPDVYVALSPSREKIRTWKVWERGAPQVAVEIISDSDASELSWQQKLTRYQRLGVQELIRFDAEAQERTLRVWDRVEGRLSERALTQCRASSLVLQLNWVVAPAEGMPRALRVEHAGKLVPTRKEAWQAEAEARQAEAEARQAEAEARQAEAEARQAEAEARQAAELRVKELEAELRRRG